MDDGGIDGRARPEGADSHCAGGNNNGGGNGRDPQSGHGAWWLPCWLALQFLQRLEKTLCRLVPVLGILGACLVDDGQESRKARIRGVGFVHRRTAVVRRTTPRQQLVEQYAQAVNVAREASVA